MAEPSKILTSSDYESVAGQASSRAFAACGNRLQIAVMRDDRAALVALVKELAHALDGRGYHECAVCDDCTFKKLIERARVVAHG